MGAHVSATSFAEPTLGDARDRGVTNGTSTAEAGMKTRTMWMLTAAAFTASALRAQSIGGTWQGTVIAGNSYRQVMKFMKMDGGWKTVYYAIDEASDSVIATSTVLTDRTLKVVFPPYLGSPTGASYEGTLGADGRSLTGTWIEPDGRYPLTLRAVTAKEAWTLPPAHTIRFVQVDTNVRLEVLDWGGSGRPMVFLAGLGGTVHGFDFFALKFTAQYHVYGITRRGYGASSAPPFTRANYLADRLGDDVLAVIDSLGLHRPVLVGHSFAGEELSSIGSRHPEKVAGLIYLDAGYSYAFYDRSSGVFPFDRRDLIQQLQRLQPSKMTVADARSLVRALRDTTLPRFEKDLDELAKTIDGLPANTAPDTIPSADRAITDGEEEYTSIPAPILAIYAVPRKPQALRGMDSAAQAATRARIDSAIAAQATAFEKGVPTAHVVRIPNAAHWIVRSNEADVVREMTTFLATVPQQ
ncbi:MAG TPA: alpha/beta hydrolase [Gemmatimonadaceae bacterium]|nr:alpha/beta hydrolase [Gemmatimonadaceae bacterium]